MVMMMIMIITRKRWRNDDNENGGDYDDTWEGGRSGERELGSSLRSLQSDLFLEKTVGLPHHGGEEEDEEGASEERSVERGRMF